MALSTKISHTALLLGFVSLSLPVSALYASELPPLGASAALDAAERASADVRHSVTQKPDKPLHDERNQKLQSRAQKALDECRQHFEAGQAMLDAQNVEGARAEFELAVNALMDLPEGLPDRAALERRAEELIRRIHRYDLEAMGAGQSPDGLLFTQSPLEGLLDLTFPVDPALKDKVLESVKASSSQLPLEVNDTVLSYINYFTSQRGRRTFMYGWKRAGRYRAMIERVFREEGLPAELIHIAQAESGFMPRAVSNRAAVGMWQFVRYTGGQYGLQADSTQDDRLDPEKATRAAARHLHDLYRQTGDWYLAMAGYNCGPMCVERAVQRTGYADFWELCRRSALPRQTQNYVPAILAMAIIAKDPAAYDMPDVDQDPPLEFDTIPLEAPTHLTLLADAAGTPVTELRELNPSLLRNVAPTGEKVKVPHGMAQSILSAIELVPEDKRASWRLHRVQHGDNLSQIARSYGVSAQALLTANSTLGAEWFEKPHVGDFVLVPSVPKSETVKSAKLAHSAKSRHATLSAKTAKKGSAKSSAHGTVRASAKASSSSKTGTAKAHAAAAKATKAARGTHVAAAHKTKAR